MEMINKVNKYEILNNELNNLAKKFKIKHSIFSIDDMSPDEKSDFLKKYQIWLQNQAIIKQTNYKTEKLETFLLNFHGSQEELISKLKNFYSASNNITIQKQIFKIISKLQQQSKNLLKLGYNERTLPLKLLDYDQGVANLYPQIFWELADRSASQYQRELGRQIPEPKLQPNKFNNFSLDEISCFFNPENFYKLDIKQVKELCQALSVKYAIKMGATPCTLYFDKIIDEPNQLTHGTYSWSNYNISMNDKYLINMYQFSKENNKYAPYQLLQTVIHETQHHVQNCNLNKNNLSKKDTLVKQALQNATDEPEYSYIGYVSELEEKDARNSALKYLKHLCRESDVKHDKYLKLFTNNAYANEYKTKKINLSGHDQEIFPDLYIEHTKKADPARDNFNNVMMERYNQYSLPNERERTKL